jgi:hypothetical protein
MWQYLLLIPVFTDVLQKEDINERFRQHNFTKGKAMRQLMRGKYIPGD